MSFKCHVLSKVKISKFSQLEKVDFLHLKISQVSPKLLKKSKDNVFGFFDIFRDFQSIKIQGKSYKYCEGEIKNLIKNVAIFGMKATKKI